MDSEELLAVVSRPVIWEPEPGSPWDAGSGTVAPIGPLSSQSMVGSGSWQRVNAQTAVRSPRYAVFDLAEGKPYVFRVLSANKHGLSEPSEITAPIQAQDTIGEQSLHVTHVRDGPRATSCRTANVDKDSNVTCGLKFKLP